MINDPAVVADFRPWFDRYEAALLSNDVEALGDLFLRTDEAVRFGPTESCYGWAEIQAFRRGRPTDDLARDAVRVVITTLGADVATAAAEFRRRESGRRVKQSQTWVRTDAGWRILQAHVSLHGEVVA